MVTILLNNKEVDNTLNNKEVDNTLRSYITSLDNPINKSTEFWISSLLGKQYENENSGITRLMIYDSLSKSSDSEYRDKFQHVESSRFSEGFVLPSSSKMVFSSRRLMAFGACFKASRIKHCENCGTGYMPFRCNDILCDVCSAGREKRIMSKYRKPIYAMKQPKLLSFGIGVVPLAHKEVVSFWHRKLYAFMRKLREGYISLEDQGRMRNGVKRKDVKLKRVPVESAFCVLEISHNLYMHFHIIVDMPYVEQAELCDLWLKVSGTRYVVDVCACSRYKALKYVTKYIVKAPEFESTYGYIYYAKIMHGRRRISTLGSLYAMDKEPDKKECFCRECGGDLTFYHGVVYHEHEFMIQLFGSMEAVP